MRDSLQEIRYMHWSLIKTVKSCADSAQCIQLTLSSVFS